MTDCRQSAERAVRAPRPVRCSLGARLTRRESGGISERIPTGSQRRAKRSAGIAVARSNAGRLVHGLLKSAGSGPRLGTPPDPMSGWGCGATGSAREWHSRGHGFDPRQLHRVSAGNQGSAWGLAAPADFKSVDSGLAPGMVGSIPTRFPPAARSRRGAWRRRPAVDALICRGARVQSLERLPRETADPQDEAGDRNSPSKRPPSPRRNAARRSGRWWRN